MTECAEQPPRERRAVWIEIALGRAQPRIEVLAAGAVADLHQALEVIEPGAPDIDLIMRQPHDMRHRIAPHEDAMAQPNAADFAVAAERHHDPAFRIGEVQEQRVRAQLLHVADEVEHQRQRAQREKQPARAAIFAERMADAVFFRDLEILLPQPVAIDRGGVDHEMRAIERGAAVGGLFDDQPGAGFLVEQFGKRGGLGQRLRIAADQRQRAAAQRVAGKQIAQHAEPERHAAGAEKHDFGRSGHDQNPASDRSGSEQGDGFAACRQSKPSSAAAITRCGACTPRLRRFCCACVKQHGHHHLTR